MFLSYTNHTFQTPHFTSQSISTISASRFLCQYKLTFSKNTLNCPNSTPIFHWIAISPTHPNWIFLPNLVGTHCKYYLLIYHAFPPYSFSCSTSWLNYTPATMTLMSEYSSLFFPTVLSLNSPSSTNLLFPPRFWWFGFPEQSLHPSTSSLSTILNTTDYYRCQYLCKWPDYYWWPN